MEITDYISQQQRITTLYDSLANPNLPDDLARSYMREFRELTGITSESGQITFYASPPVNKVDEFIEGAYRVTMLIGLSMMIVPIVFIVRDHIRFKRALKKQTPVQKRLDWLLDEERVASYTNEQFKVAMAEVSALLANKALGLLSQDELEKVQAQICEG